MAPGTGHGALNAPYLACKLHTSLSDLTRFVLRKQETKDVPERESAGWGIHYHVAHFFKINKTKTNSMV
jgi:hypothetical protein